MENLDTEVTQEYDTDSGKKDDESEKGKGKTWATWLAEIAEDQGQADIAHTFAESFRQADLDRQNRQSEFIGAIHNPDGYPYNPSPNIAIEGTLAMTHQSLGQQVRDGDLLVYIFKYGADNPEVEISQSQDNLPLSKEEVEKNSVEIDSKKFEEIFGLEAWKL